MRKYKTLIDYTDEELDLHTVEEWKHIVNVMYGNDDGCGYWCKDGFKSHDEVFSTPQLDATHVIWYSK